MNSAAHLAWPFFEASHRDFKVSLQDWTSKQFAGLHGHDESRDAIDKECVSLVKALGQGGWLKPAIAGKAHGGASEVIDTRTICLLREELAWHHGLADFAFAMQGLGSGAISLKGTPEQQAAYLPRVASGSALAAFALSEPDAGSDVAAISAMIHNPRNGVMPAWGDRLDPVTINSLTLYVQSLGGGR